MLVAAAIPEIWRAHLTDSIVAITCEQCQIYTVCLHSSNVFFVKVATDTRCCSACLAKWICRESSVSFLHLSRASEQWARTVEQTGSVLKRVQLQVEREALCESIAQAPTKSHTLKDTAIFVGTCEVLDRRAWRRSIRCVSACRLVNQSCFLWTHVTWDVKGVTRKKLGTLAFRYALVRRVCNSQLIGCPPLPGSPPPRAAMCGAAHFSSSLFAQHLIIKRHILSNRLERARMLDKL